jgi:hypothetical protein
MGADGAARGREDRLSAPPYTPEMQSELRGLAARILGSSRHGAVTLFERVRIAYVAPHAYL